MQTAGCARGAPDRTRELPLFLPRRITAVLAALSLVVLPAPPAAAHVVPAAPNEAAYLLPPDPAAATRVAAERAARGFTRRMTPPAAPVAQPRVVQAVVQKPAVKKTPVVKAPVEKVTVTASGSIGAVISFALAQQGDPYQWGATGPNRWDCSSLVQASFRQAGVSLPRVSGDIARRGRAVPRSEWRPGDVLAYPGHVSIYLGSGRMIHAPHSGDVVRIAAVYGSPQGRRIIG